MITRRQRLFSATSKEALYILMEQVATWAEDAHFDNERVLDYKPIVREMLRMALMNDTQSDSPSTSKVCYVPRYGIILGGNPNLPGIHIEVSSYSYAKLWKICYEERELTTTSAVVSETTYIPSRVRTGGVLMGKASTYAHTPLDDAQVDEYMTYLTMDDTAEIVVSAHGVETMHYGERSELIQPGEPYTIFRFTGGGNKQHPSEFVVIETKTRKV